MSYRTLLAAIAAVAIATPVFADDTAATTTTTQSTETTTTAPAPAASDNTMQQTTSTETTTTTQMKVNINKASAKELMKVKGLNASKARAIVAYRKKHGDFKTLDELSNVKGFKNMKSDKMQDIEGQLTVE